MQARRGDFECEGFRLARFNAERIGISTCRMQGGYRRKPAMQHAEHTASLLARQEQAGSGKALMRHDQHKIMRHGIRVHHRDDSPAMHRPRPLGLQIHERSRALGLRHLDGGFGLVGLHFFQDRHQVNAGHPQGRIHQITRRCGSGKGQTGDCREQHADSYQALEFTHSVQKLNSPKWLNLGSVAAMPRQALAQVMLTLRQSSADKPKSR